MNRKKSKDEPMDATDAIVLECGCIVEIDWNAHPQGDRYVECGCERAWVVGSHQVIHITRTVREVVKRVKIA
jgi:hypothetical protein